MINYKKKSAILITAGVISSVFSGFAAAESDVKNNYTIGLGYSNSTKYSGSDERSDGVTPFFNLQYENFFVDDTDGIGFIFESSNGVYFSQAVGYSFGRSEGDSNWRAGSDKLKGMGEIKGTPTSSTTLGWSYGGFLIESNITAPLAESEGVKYRGGVKYHLWSNDRNDILFSSNAYFGDSRYTNTYYGVSKNQSERTGFKSFNSGAGLYKVDASVTWTHSFNENWWGYADVTYNNLTKKVNKSDIVMKNNSTDVSVGVLYSF